MLKRLSLAAVLVGGGLLLSGCDVTTGGGPTPAPNIEVSKIIEAIQEKAATVCRFVPTEGTILSLLRFYSPDAAGVVKMVREICNVVIKKSGAFVLHGVPVEGRFVSRPPRARKR